jgi:hypothetical protein
MLKMQIHSGLYLADIPGKGRGVFTNIDLNPMEIVEISSVLVLEPEQRKAVELTELYNYIFEWGEDQKSCCVAWGYISMYNHSYTSNCEYIMDFDTRTITIQTVRPIKKGEELTINYNGDWNNAEKVWFDTI